VILPVVPMFHVNAWGLPYAACMTGAKLVFPAPASTASRSTSCSRPRASPSRPGVPTVWQGLLTYVDGNDLRFSTMTRTIIGGSACPPAMMRTFQDRYGVKVLHAWGMTEMSPVGTVSIIKGSQKTLSGEEQFQVQAKQGRAVYGVDMKIVTGDGEECRGTARPRAS
jgi:fatty-acyl-CoA synthase